MTRGLDLNNPMNLKISAHFKWDGEIRPTSDPGKVLCQFLDVERGLRAGSLNLYNQQILHGLCTWCEIITKYAPPSENNTEAYIAHMCSATGVGPTDHIYLTDLSFLAKAVHAVILHEQGRDPYENGEVEKVISMFFKPRTAIGDLA